MTTTTRDRIHQLVDTLPEHELRAAERYLEYLRDTTDPLLLVLEQAPIDDEPETPEEVAAVAEAYAEIAAGKTLSTAELLQLLAHDQER